MSHECPRNGCNRSVSDDRLVEAQEAAIRAVNGEPDPASKPSPYELWVQSGENGPEYRRLLRAHGLIVGPGDEGYDPDAPRTLPCGWSPDKAEGGGDE